MKKSAHISLLTLLCFTFCISMAWAKGAEIIMKGDMAFIMKDGKQNPLKESFSLVYYDKLSLYAVGVYKEENNPQFDDGIFFFKKGEEKALTFVPTPLGGVLNSTYSISPDKKILAVQLAATTDGTWLFLSLPDLKVVGEVEYYSVENDLPVWIDDMGKKGVLVSQRDPEATFTKERKVQYDPGFAQSASYYDFNSKKTTVLMKGTALCNYTIKGYKDGKALIDALCTKKAEDWTHFPVNVPLQRIEKKF